jgi:hypothetical protein
MKRLLSTLLLLSACSDDLGTEVDAAGDGADAGVPVSPDASEVDGATPVPPDAAPLADAASLPAGAIAIVSPDVCTLVNHHLRDCDFGPVTVTAPAPPAANPVKTVVRAHKAGDCSTQFEFAVRLSASGVDAIDTRLFLDPDPALRRDDGSPIDALTVEDVSPFAGVPVYDETCRVWLEVDWNLPDAE